MGLLQDFTGPLANFLESSSAPVVVATGFFTVVVLLVVVNVLHQQLLRDPTEPPLVFHWFPIIGSTITYGIDPYKFFFSCRQKYGDVFTFVLLGKKTTVYLGTAGNNFILNAKHSDLNAEEVYSDLCTPVFGKDVVYDCPNAKLMEQKKFVKFGLTTDALHSYVELITSEVENFLKRSVAFKGAAGEVNLPKVMAELTIYTASRSLQGKEVRERFDSSFAELYHDLDMGFSPINFMLPWAPLPHNRRRDAAQQKMTEVYTEIIQKRKAAGGQRDSQDMIWNLMSCVYKDGTPVPDNEIAHMMIALLMAGQHSSSATIAWILLHLAAKPEIAEELIAEQKRVLGEDLPPISHAELAKLPLHNQVVRETLRINAPIHSMIRRVNRPMPIPATPFVIPRGRNLLAAPGVSSQSQEHFVNPQSWDPHRWDTYINPEEADDDKIDYGFGLMSKGANSPYLPFGAGRHRCIGEQFAYVQLQTILVNIIREFKFKNIDGSRETVGTDYSSLFSRPLQPAVVAWERRKE